mgnify:CR=1 FL=1
MNPKENLDDIIVDQIKSDLTPFMDKTITITHGGGYLKRYKNKKSKNRNRKTRKKQKTRKKYLSNKKQYGGVVGIIFGVIAVIVMWCYFSCVMTKPQIIFN